MLSTSRASSTPTLNPLTFSWLAETTISNSQTLESAKTYLPATTNRTSSLERYRIAPLRCSVNSPTTRRQIFGLQAASYMKWSPPSQHSMNRGRMHFVKESSRIRYQSCLSLTLRVLVHCKTFTTCACREDKRIGQMCANCLAWCL